MHMSLVSVQKAAIYENRVLYYGKTKSSGDGMKHGSGWTCQPTDGKDKNTDGQN